MHGFSYGASLITRWLDQAGLVSLAGTSRQHAKWVFDGKRLCSVLELGTHTKRGIALLIGLGQDKFEIRLPKGFNQQVDQLPTGITHLTLGAGFNQSVDQLHAGVTHLTFGYEFNQPVDQLRAGITHLTFGYLFNQPVDQLPAGITQLTVAHSI